MTSKKNRFFSLLLTMLLLFSFCSTAFALNIVDKDLYDYFEYYKDGTWQDLNTVMYTDPADGDVGYCIEHEAKPPRPSVDYVPYDISGLFNNYTLTGIQAILNRGYPADNNGFSDEAAFYATANALRFWIKESCGQGYDFMILENGLVRVKSGGEAVWNWCMELLQYARSQDVGGSASVHVSPSSPKWTLSNGQLITTLSVSSSNGYSITASDPEVTISGYTGGRSDKLTITAPATLSSTDVSLYITAAAGSVSTVDLGFYAPDSGTRQKLVFVEMVSGTTGQSKTVSITGNFYDLTVNKTDASTGAALDGAKFKLTSSGTTITLTKTDKLTGKVLVNVPFKLIDSSGNALRYTQREDGSYKVTASGADTFLTDAEGKAMLSHIPEGSYRLVEQIFDMYATHVEVTVAVTDTNTEATPANANLENCPTAFTLTKVDAETKAALDNVKFILKDAEGNVVPISLMDDGTYRPAYAEGEDTVAISNATLTTDGNGEFVIHYLKHGTYTLIEQQKAGYAPLKDISFEITSAHSIEAPLAMTVENSPGTLVISKTDAVTKAALPGTRFKVLDESGNVIKLVQENDVYRPAKSTETGVNELTVGADGTATVKYITGKVTIRESGAPAGYAYAADANATVGMTAISHENGDTTLAMETVEIADQPLALRISKIHAKTLKPLKGAAFEIRSGDGTTPMTFELKDGIYWYSKAGTITTITMDENAQALVCGLPAAKYKLVETVVPNGFFPAPAQDFTVQLTDTYEKPLEITVTNTPEVKLGLDSDKWDDMLLMGGGILLLAGTATFIYFKKRRTTR